jgi:hypothetical protein
VAKRLFWLMLGFGLGVGVTVRASRTVQRALERALPPGTYAQLRAFGAAVEERAAVIRSRRQTSS